MLLGNKEYDPRSANITGEVAAVFPQELVDMENANPLVYPDVFNPVSCIVSTLNHNSGTFMGYWNTIEDFQKTQFVVSGKKLRGVNFQTYKDANYFPDCGISFEYTNSIICQRISSDKWRNYSLKLLKCIPLNEIDNLDTVHPIMTTEEVENLNMDDILANLES